MIKYYKYYILLFLTIVICSNPAFAVKCKRIDRSLLDYITDFTKNEKEMTVIIAKVTGHVYDVSGLGLPFLQDKGKRYYSGNNVIRVKALESLLGDGSSVQLYELDTQYNNSIFDRKFPIGTEFVIFGVKNKYKDKVMLQMRGFCRNSILKIKDNSVIGYITRSSDADKKKGYIKDETIMTVNRNELFYPRGPEPRKVSIAQIMKITSPRHRKKMAGYIKANDPNILSPEQIAEYIKTSKPLNLPPEKMAEYIKVKRPITLPPEKMTMKEFKAFLSKFKKKK